MMKNKVIALMLAAALGAGLTGCGSTADTNKESTADTSVTAEEQAERKDASAAEGESEESSEDTSSEEETEASSAAKSKESAKTDTEAIPSSTQEVFAMDTYMSITGYGEKAEEAVEASVAEIERLDALLSVGNEDSEIAKINAEGKGKISDDTAVMLKKALEIGETTGGKFDVTIYPLMVEWGFTSGDFKVPEEDTLKELLKNVDYKKVNFDESTNEVSIGEGQGIDLGGIAKGFTSDRVMEIFEEYDLLSGVVSLGGNVECYGTKIDGSKWRCGIQDPTQADDASAMLGVIEVADTAVITSGAYERNFTDEESGTLYHHIIDPAIGYSANNGLISVSIVSESGLLADGLSTSMYILGKDDAIAYWQEYGDDFEMILMTEDNQIYITEGIRDQFTGNYPVTVVEREG